MSYVLTAALLLGISIPSSPAAAKAKAPKLSSKKISIKVGQKKTIKVKNTKKKVSKRLIDRRRPQYKHPITECSTLDTFTSIFKLA